MLTCEIRRADAANAPLIILMHGRGANRFDLLGLADVFPENATLVFPEAPFPATPWGYGPGSAWYRFMGRNRPDADSFSTSLDELATLIKSLDASRVVLGGFSQGGTMAMGYALSHPGAVTGVLNFSGFLPDHPRVVLQPGDTKFFWAHGTQDTSIPFDLAIEGRAQLERAGATLESRDYDIGHWIDPVELQHALQWLDAFILRG